MGGSHSIVMSFALNNTLYNAGDTMKGYVEVTVLADDVEIPELTVELMGVASTSVRYTSSGKNKKKRTAHQHVTLLKVQSKVRQMDTNRLTKGVKFQLPFEFTIPADAVSSMPLVRSGRNKASITYKVGVYSTEPGKLWGTSTACLSSVVVDVVAAQPQSIEPSRLEEAVSVTRCCCIPAGGMSLAAKSSLSAYKAGDVPEVNYEVGNRTSQELEHVEVCVQRTIHWSARGHGKTTQSKIVTLKQAGLEAGAKFGFGGAEGARNVALSVPDLAYFTTSTSTINVTYNLIVKAKTASSFVRDPEIHLPLIAYRLGPSIAEAIDLGNDGHDDDNEAIDEVDDEEGAEQPVIIATVIDYAPDPSLTIQIVDASTIVIIDDNAR